MNYKMMGRFLALILTVEGIMMVPALLISLFCHTGSATLGFLIGIGICAVLAVVLFLLTRGSASAFFAKEGLLCVGVGWILMSFVGCLPFWISGEIPDFIDAFFETVSGFTTTGASILSNPEGLSKAALYWRSFTHWLGGMGVLVFLLAIVPAGGKDDGFTMHLLRAESPGPEVGKLVPKMRQTAAMLYGAYILLTILCFLFLLIGKMPLFDAVCTALGTAGTGGFGIKGDSMGSYSPFLQNVVTVFMILFGINFACYILLFFRKFRDVLKDEELRFYLLTILVCVTVISLNIYGKFPETQTVSDTVRHSAFQVGSIITTSGFCTVNFDLWPTLSKVILLFLMLSGACAGSTGGGFKCARLLLLFKGVKRNISKMLKPRRVQTVRVSDRPIDEKVMANTNAYLAAYFMIIVFSFLILSIDSFSETCGFSGVETNFTAVLSCLNNIGPGLGGVGPYMNYEGYNVLSKVVLIIDMLAGRLEIFPILCLFSRDLWKGR